MNKSKYVALVVLSIVTLAGIRFGSAGEELNASASSQNSVLNNEVVFSIPLGENGIHYEGKDNLDMLTWGPTALTVAPDGTFWIADAADDHLLHFSQKRVLLDKISIGDLVTGAGDLEVTFKEIWVLDMASIPPRLIHLSLDGKVLSIFDLPEGLYLEDGLSGIALGSDGSVIIELVGGHTLIQLISPSGKIEQQALEGYEYKGNVYSAYPADFNSNEDKSHGYILAGNKRIEVEVANDLGGLRILHVNSDGSFFVEVAELVFDTAFRVDQKVFHYDSFGNLVGMARVPLAEQYVTVSHSIAVGLDGEVYALVTRPDGGEVQRLAFSTKLAPILVPPVVSEQTEAHHARSFSAGTCRSRADIINVAIDYMDNSPYLNSYHINDPGNECPERQKPRYLGSPGIYYSVPYAWDMWDTVKQFNNFMSIDNNGRFAGDIDEPNPGCSRGIDCSGLISRAWDLGYHHGTCTLEGISYSLLSTDSLLPGDIMNRCAMPSRHAIIFDRFHLDGMKGYEATTYLNYDRVAYIFRSFSDIKDTHTPRRYENVCNRIHLPIIKNMYIVMRQADPSTDPYPPPNPYP